MIMVHLLPDSIKPYETIIEKVVQHVSMQIPQNFQELFLSMFVLLSGYKTASPRGSDTREVSVLLESSQDNKPCRNTTWNSGDGCERQFKGPFTPHKTTSLEVAMASRCSTGTKFYNTHCCLTGFTHLPDIHIKQTHLPLLQLIWYRRKDYPDINTTHPTTQ